MTTEPLREAVERAFPFPSTTGLSFVSQKAQDRWVIEEALPARRGGFFLDLAATDGIKLNNTLLLEREFGWTGIAIEPHPQQFKLLSTNRNCHVSNACVDTDFHDVDFLPNGALGGIVDADTDNNWQVRSKLLRAGYAAGDVLRLKTRPLIDVLREFNAPKVIDYFSLDVEGAETRILRGFPFTEYTFLTLTIERPTPELNRLLFGNGYRFVRNVFFDSFYVHGTALNYRGRVEPFEQIPSKDW